VNLVKPAKPVVIQSNSGIFSVTPDKTAKFNKVLFVVDKSGSNVDNSPGPGNDADNAKRAGSMETFFAKKKGDLFYKWGFIVFGINKNKSEAWINDGGNVNVGKFGTPDEMDRALKMQRAVSDDGCTPYMGALTLARQTIEKDIKDHPDEDSVYNIFFMSDGFPNDTGGSGSSSCGSYKTIQNTPNDPYLKAVEDLRKPAPGRIFLSTAYYADAGNDKSRAAANGLSFMAKAGGGNFVDLRNNGKINFDEIQTGEIPIPLVVKRMFAVNLNAGFCDDGGIGADSDADGICDRDEQIYNSTYSTKIKDLNGIFDPAQRNSFDKDYSDLFVYTYQVLPNGSGLTKCMDHSKDKDFDFLSTCEESMMQDAAPNGPTPQWTQGMSINGADSNNSDSDGDGFLDGLEWMTFRSRSSAINYQTLLQPFAGGLPGEQIIREHRNVLNPQSFGRDQYDGNLVFTGVNDNGENTYRYDQTQLALYPTLETAPEHDTAFPLLAHKANENIVFVYFIAVPENDPNGRGVLYYSFQKFPYQDASLTVGIRFDQFKTYHIPKIK